MYMQASFKVTLFQGASRGTGNARVWNTGSNQLFQVCVYKQAPARVGTERWERLQGGALQVTLLLYSICLSLTLSIKYIKLSSSI